MLILIVLFLCVSDVLVLLSLLLLLQLPRVDLPLAIDIILHPNVVRDPKANAATASIARAASHLGLFSPCCNSTSSLSLCVRALLPVFQLPHKSTALQTLLLAHPRASVHTYPSLPAFDAAHTAVVFPSDRALTVQQLAHRLRSRSTAPDRGAGAAAPLDAGAASDSDPSSCVQQQQQPAGEEVCPLVSLGRVLFLEGTWGEAEQMLVHPRLQPLAHLRLDFSAEASISAAEAPAGENAAAASCPSTSFWRYQRFGAAFLSSIEAIYHCMKQISEQRVPLADPETVAGTAAPTTTSPAGAAAPASSPHRFDNLLWLFAMAYQRVRAHYCSQPTLLPPVQG